MVFIAWAIAALLAAVLCIWLTRVTRTAVEHEGPWRRALARFHENRAAMIALYVIVALYTIAALAPWLAPHPASAMLDIVALANVAPSSAFPMGTDPLSRDVLSRIVYGARVSLGVALLSVLVSCTIGTAYGAVAGLAGGRVDAILMRLADAAFSIPRLLLLIAVLTLWPRVPIWALVLMIGLTGWFGVSRVVRAQVLSLRDHDFVVSARALGAAQSRILWRHVLPNVLSPVIVAATLGIGNVIILEAGLSFLGIGVREPTPSWGSIINDAGNQFFFYWWLTLFPGLAIVTTVMAFNVIGDGLRDALDPQQVVG
ncbi:MAG TPA: ABC transporter permease [Gemmatimonadaceae bacterium]|nr:ABC transporter permease [Gemmatimonadaceae bacterium]